ncbi:class I SAM-dependent methyltransferase [Micromonospora sp. NPDC049799]|uniref:class I SAM-dependent methyltransferase n=1 Tax=Micromonospora sp. NPDC049799 TaxID=3154741 RepID=UPI0033C2ACFD
MAGTAGWEVSAVDFSAVAIERGRELARQRDVSVDWQVADGTEYKPPADGFNLVLIAYLHLPAAEIAAVLATARPAVRADGRVLVVGHDLGNLSGGTGGPQDPDILLTPRRW